MKGLLKNKSAGTQFIILVGIALGSFFLIGVLGTVLLTKITGISLATLSDNSKWDYSDDRLVTVIRGMQVIQFITLFLLPTFLCARLFSSNEKKYLGLKKPADVTYWLIGAAILLLAIPLVNFFGEINRHAQFPAGLEKWLKAQEEEAARTIKALLSKHTIKDLLLNVFCIAGLAAVGEELLFRGIAQRLLIKMFKSPVAGIIVAAFLFSAMHVQFYGFLPRFILGIVLGMLYWYSGSLWVAMLAHFVYDGLLIVLAYFNQDMLDESKSVKLSAVAAGAGISLLLVVALASLMIKKSTVTYKEVYADDGIPAKDYPF